MSAAEKRMAVFSGSVAPELAEGIADELGIALGDVKLEKFANGEIYARFLSSVRDMDVFLIQSVAGQNVNDALMELLIMADAAKRASARSITAVVSHYGYARQDRKAASREPITAKLVADLMQASGITHIITIDLHVSQIEGYFNIPVDHLTALPVLAEYFRNKNLDNMCVVSPDMGRAKAAKRFADILGCDVAIMHKTRPAHNVAEITALIGDVEGKTCIINDDMIDTGGSVVAAVSSLKAKGAEEVYLCATHAVFSGPAYERLCNCDAKEVVVTDTIPVDKAKCGDKISVVSIAPMLAEAIKDVHGGIAFDGSRHLDIVL